MAVHAKQFPVAAVGGIVVVVVVFVMDRQLMKFLTGEFASAPRTNPGKNLERLLTVSIPAALPVVPRLGNEVIHYVANWPRRFR